MDLDGKAVPPAWRDEGTLALPLLGLLRPGLSRLSMLLLLNTVGVLCAIMAHTHLPETAHKH